MVKHDAPHSSPLVSSIKISYRGSHAILRIWNRGGLAGQLVIPVEDVYLFVERIASSDTQIEGLTDDPHEQSAKHAFDR